MNTRSRGFTLVELAIVLVIIGLLMGGILKGQELINSAKAKTMANDFRVVATAYYAYADRFHAVPGDDKAANTHVVGTNASTGGTLGNGRIEGQWNSVTTTDESFLFWQHVRLAGLLSGSTDTAAAAYAPVNADGGRIGITGDVNTANNKPLDSGSWNASFWVCAGNITGRIARQLDIMLDDGVGTSGSLRIGTTTNNAATSTDALSDGASYYVCVAY